MRGICRIKLFIPIPYRLQQSCSFEYVKFNVYGICGFSEFRFKTPKMSLGTAIKEKLLQQPDSGLRSYKTTSHSTGNAGE